MLSKIFIQVLLCIYIIVDIYIIYCCWNIWQTALQQQVSSLEVCWRFVMSKICIHILLPPCIIAIGMFQAIMYIFVNLRVKFSNWIQLHDFYVFILPWSLKVTWWNFLPLFATITSMWALKDEKVYSVEFRDITALHRPHECIYCIYSGFLCSDQG